jgi:predicted CopG family antitoxin
MRKKKYTKNVGVLLSEDTYDKLIRITNEKELPISEFLRELIEEGLQERGEEGKNGK